MKTLVIFTSYFPFNLYETYLEIEIHYLAKVFDEIYIISNESDASFKRETPANIKVFSVPYSLNFFDKISSWFQLFNSEFWKEIKFVRTQYKQPVTSKIVNTILQSLHKAKGLKATIEKFIPGITERKDVTLYSYWANDSAVSIAYLRKKYAHIKAVTRAHRWDVYFDTNESNYLPFRKTLAQSLNHIYFISDHAKNYFIEKTGLQEPSFYVSRLGVFSFSSPTQKQEPNTCHLVSCSHVYARKRVALIAKALRNVDDKYVIKWTHIGDGDHSMVELQEIIDDIRKEKKNITIDITGRMMQEEVKQFYEQNYVDLFINVSESEGVPVSIMESFSASIPAIATDADGTREIVINKLNGFLVNCELSPSQLAGYIQEYIELPDETKTIYRANARKMYIEKYNEKNNYDDFIASLLNIP